MPTDWAAWSREAVRTMQQRSEIADAVFVGSVSVVDGTFMWSWANETTSVRDRLRMEAVRNFGREHDLRMLTEGEWRGGRAEGLEAVAIAGRARSRGVSAPAPIESG